MKRLIRYAYDKDKNFVFIDDVKVNGNNCGCTCTECGGPLCAKKEGRKNTHHFAHQSGIECEYGYETALHLLSKKIIAERKCITLPKTDDSTHSTGVLYFSEVHVEPWNEELSIRPDLECITEDGEHVLIEIFKSHKVDFDKRKKIVDNNLLCIEIDVRNQKMDEESLRHFLLESDESREWITEDNPIPFVKKTKELTQADINKEKVKRHIIELYYEKRLKFKYDQFTKCSAKGCKWRTYACDIHITSVKLVQQDFRYDDLKENPRFTDYNGKTFKADIMLKSTSRTDALPIIISLRKNRRDFFDIEIKGAYLIDIVVEDDAFVNDLISQDYIEIGKDFLNSYGTSQRIYSNLEIRDVSVPLNSQIMCLLKYKDNRVVMSHTDCRKMDDMPVDVIYKLTFGKPKQYMDDSYAYFLAFKLASQLGRNLDMSFCPPELNGYGNGIEITLYHETFKPEAAIIDDFEDESNIQFPMFYTPVEQTLFTDEEMGMMKS